MSNDNRDIGYAAVGLIFGVWAFFHGFKKLRRKRRIENIPTSTVRGMAMGLVEVFGSVEPSIELYSALTHTPCVFFHYTIEEYRRSGKSGHWVRVDHGNSFECPFWLGDGTGKVLIYPRGAELMLPVDYEYTTSLGMTIPDHLAGYMAKKGMRHKSMFGTRNLRFKEWFIAPGEEVYVLGTAKKTKYKIAPKDPSPGDVTDVVIGRGTSDRLFMISDSSEKELVKKLFTHSLWGIYGGAALSLAMLVYLMVRLGLISF